MKYDGVVIRFDKLYLFILDPDTDMIRDGITISEHDCYKDMKEDQLMVVSVIFKDGTLEIDKIDLDEFIHGDKYGDNNINIIIIYDKLNCHNKMNSLIIFLMLLLILFSFPLFLFSRDHLRLILKVLRL